MRVLIGCEFSGIVRDAFKEQGHDAWSCDLLPTERPGKHFQYDLLTVLDCIGDEFDLAIFHPPCTYLAVSGARWFKEPSRKEKQNEALEFVKKLMDAPIKHIALENPISVISTRIRKPDQIVQPWMFGHGETKSICLWLKNLPKLVPTDIVSGRQPRVHFESPSPERWKNRSRTYVNLAKAMAIQWGSCAD